MHSLAKALKKKVIGKTSDVLSAPARFRADGVKRRVDEDIKIIKNHRAMKERPSYGQTHEDQKTEALYKDIRKRYGS